MYVFYNSWYTYNMCGPTDIMELFTNGQKHAIECGLYE